MRDSISRSPITSPTRETAGHPAGAHEPSDAPSLASRSTGSSECVEADIGPDASNSTRERKRVRPRNVGACARSESERQLVPTSVRVVVGEQVFVAARVADVEALERATGDAAALPETAEDRVDLHVGSADAERRRREIEADRVADLDLERAVVALERRGREGGLHAELVRQAGERGDRVVVHAAHRRHEDDAVLVVDAPEGEITRPPVGDEVLDLAEHQALDRGPDLAEDDLEVRPGHLGVVGIDDGAVVDTLPLPIDEDAREVARIGRHELTQEPREVALDLIALRLLDHGRSPSKSRRVVSGSASGNASTGCSSSSLETRSTSRAKVHSFSMAS